MSSNKKYNAAGTSRADKIIDAVSEARAEEGKPKNGCPICGHTKFTQRQPLGGPSIKICLSCGYKTVAARGRGVTPLLPENTNHKQGTAKGPTKNSLNPKPKTDKHLPRYRSKGKSNDK